MALPANLGYSDKLFILAFDHRGSFASKLFGIKGEPTAEETKEIASYKKIIYDGFKAALENGVPKITAGILVDEQFGNEIIEDAKKNGIQFANPAEKSGQPGYDFEYGEDFGKHIESCDPRFVKVLVRYNPADDAELNKNQIEKLKRLSDYCHKTDRKFLFEVLVPATKDQLKSVQGNQSQYEQKLRPKLMIQAIEEIQKGGVEPDIWKIEGVDRIEDAEAIAKQTTIDGRGAVNNIILGRGANEEKVKDWLAVGAKAKGYSGFAVGRTIFWEPLKGVREGRWSNKEASQMIAKTYQALYQHWVQNEG